MGRPKGSKNKTHAGHLPAATAVNKANFLKAMAQGMQPYLAAETAGIGSSTAFAWKADDPEFAAKWQEAYELGLDRLEHIAYDSGNPSNIQFLLKGRRKEVYGTQYDEQRAVNTNPVLQVTDEEHQRRLERLGLVAPLMIETDYEEDNVDVHSRAGNDSASSSASTGHSDDDSS